ncbi:MAG: hypothetical protein ABEJ99_05095 [Candidatus Nanohaloarchaea archaeon]
MGRVDDLSIEQRTGGGFLFLIIAIAVLFSQPFDNKFLLAGFALLNMLISAAFFVNMGKDSAEVDGFDFNY